MDDQVNSLFITGIPLSNLNKIGNMKKQSFVAVFVAIAGFRLKSLFSISTHGWKLSEIFVVWTFYPKFVVYRQLGDSNSQWHKQKFKKVPVWGSASWGKCQLGEVLVGGSASWRKCQLGEVPVGGLVPVGGQKFNPWTDDFFPIL